MVGSIRVGRNCTGLIGYLRRDLRKRKATSRRFIKNRTKTREGEKRKKYIRISKKSKKRRKGERTWKRKIKPEGGPKTRRATFGPLRKKNSTT